MVAALGETTGTTALRKMRDQMLQTESGRKILRERPIIHTSTIDFSKLRETCAPGSFGHFYISWLDSQGVTPDTREPVRTNTVVLFYMSQKCEKINNILFFY